MDVKKLDDLEIYKFAIELSRLTWQVFEKLPYLHKCHQGYQFLDAVDSVGANIAEGFGRYTKKDKINFYRYSFGSLKESQDWTEKAKIRKLLTLPEYNTIMGELQKLPLELNSLIKFTNSRLTI